MSRSDRDEAVEPAVATTHRGDPFPEVPYPWSVRAGSPPSNVSGGMRTIDPAPGIGANRLEDFEPRYLVARAAAIIQQMELGWGEAISSEDDRFRLGYGKTPNCVTGEPGIFVCRLVAPGLYSEPLAELLVPAGEFEKYGTAAFARLGMDLAKRRLQIVVYRGEGETSARPVVFAVAVDDENPDQFWLRARLLVTPFEISQWWDPTVETVSGTIQ